MGSALLLVGLGISAGTVSRLLPSATPETQLGAAAAVLGGFIGAAGTALAVYLTLASQRADEAERVEAALRVEVSEFARLAVGQLSICDAVRTQLQGYQLALRDLPAFLSMPEAPVFTATADRVSRLSYGSLIVVFHARIAEVQQLVRVYSALAAPLVPVTNRFTEMEEGFRAHRLLDANQAKTLSLALCGVCEVARSILTRDPAGLRLAEEVVAQTLGDLEKARKWHGLAGGAEKVSDHAGS
jgi:sulfur relay (sulfurtransferase) complex TusBCD TusD component (DsrE family)